MGPNQTFIARILRVKHEAGDGEASSPVHAEYRRLMLAAYMAILTFAVAVVFAVVDFINSVNYSWPVYAIVVISSTLTLVLLRLGKVNIARIVLFLATNLAISWAIVLDPPGSGAAMFLIPTGLAAFFLFGVVNIRTSFILSAITFTLFFILHFAGDSPLRQNASQEYIELSFVVNFVLVFIISVAGVYFLLALNTDYEKQLLESKDILQAKNQELEKINREMDRFVYSVSHDLRSPLASILGLVQISEFSEDPVELKQILQMVKSRVQVQEHFMEELLDYSRNSRTEIKKEEIQLGEFVDRVINTLGYQDNKIQIRNNVDRSVVVLSDRIRLAIILRNLISNAVKYADCTKPEPFVLIEADGARPTIAVKDNGIGIPTAAQPQIFDMFYRATEKSGGSGLGLFICSEAISRLGGHIEVSSTVGEGSTFSVHL